MSNSRESNRNLPFKYECRHCKGGLQFFRTIPALRRHVESHGYKLYTGNRTSLKGNYMFLQDYEIRR